MQSRAENDWLGRGPVKEIAWTAVDGLGLQRTTVSHYRHDGKLVKKDRPNRKSCHYSYDNRANLETIWYPDSTRAAMMYDLNGNLVQTIVRRNLFTTLAYNQPDMLVSKTTVDAVRGDTVVAATYTQAGPARVKTEDGAAIAQNGQGERNLWIDSLVEWLEVGQNKRVVTLLRPPLNFGLLSPELAPRGIEPLFED